MAHDAAICTVVSHRLGASLVNQVRQKLLRLWPLILLLGFISWASLHPREFVGLWFTADQYGWLQFKRGLYDEAAKTFDDPRWRGLSLYAAQDFNGAAQYFSQYRDEQSLLARANALAHAREYLDARDAYEELSNRFPESLAPSINLPIIQELIDANRELSESQQAEVGDLSSEQEDGPRSSEGDERVSVIEREQLSADELLQNPALTQSWLRQVQRDPSEFLSTKFYIQLEREREVSP